MDRTKNLPDTVMLSVFLYIPKLGLPRCAMVCRRWRRLASDQSLWTKVDLSNKKLSFRTLAKVLECGVRELKLEKATVEKPPTLAGMFKANFKSPLRVLDLTGTRMFADCIEEILRHTGELVELRMRHCSLNHSVFVAIGQNSNLEILDLSYAGRIDNSWISHALQQCKKLKDLNMETTMLELCMD